MYFKNLIQQNTSVLETEQPLQDPIITIAQTLLNSPEQYLSDETYEENTNFLIEEFEKSSNSKATSALAITLYLLAQRAPDNFSPEVQANIAFLNQAISNIKSIMPTNDEFCQHKLELYPNNASVLDIPYEKAFTNGTITHHVSSLLKHMDLYKMVHTPKKAPITIFVVESNFLLSNMGGINSPLILLLQQKDVTCIYLVGRSPDTIEDTESFSMLLSKEPHNLQTIPIQAEINDIETAKRIVSDLKETCQNLSDKRVIIKYHGISRSTLSNLIEKEITKIASGDNENIDKKSGKRLKSSYNAKAPSSTTDAQRLPKLTVGARQKLRTQKQEYQKDHFFGSLHLNRMPRMQQIEVLERSGYQIHPLTDQALVVTRFQQIYQMLRHAFDKNITQNGFMSTLNGIDVSTQVEMILARIKLKGPNSLYAEAWDLAKRDLSREDLKQILKILSPHAFRKNKIHAINGLYTLLKEYKNDIPDILVPDDELINRFKIICQALYTVSSKSINDEKFIVTLTGLNAQNATDLIIKQIDANDDDSLYAIAWNLANNNLSRAELKKVLKTRYPNAFRINQDVSDKLYSLLNDYNKNTEANIIVGDFDLVKQFKTIYRMLRHATGKPITINGFMSTLEGKTTAEAAEMIVRRIDFKGEDSLYGIAWDLANKHLPSQALKEAIKTKFPAALTEPTFSMFSSKPAAINHFYDLLSTVNTESANQTIIDNKLINRFKRIYRMLCIASNTTEDKAFIDSLQPKDATNAANIIEKQCDAKGDDSLYANAWVLAEQELTSMALKREIQNKYPEAFETSTLGLFASKESAINDVLNWYVHDNIVIESNDMLIIHNFKKIYTMICLASYTTEDKAFIDTLESQESPQARQSIMAQIDAAGESSLYAKAMLLALKNIDLKELKAELKTMYPDAFKKSMFGLFESRENVIMAMATEIKYDTTNSRSFS